MGVVTKTIGTSARDYSTLQAWEDALPANLVTDGNSQVGECYNDSEFTSASTILTIAGETTDSTHTITLRPATGQGFRDNAGVQSNALKYNQANGVGIRSTIYSGDAVVVSVDNVFLDGLQIKGSGTYTKSAVAATGAMALTNSILDCSRAAGATNGVVRLINGATRSVLNCLIVNREPAGRGIQLGSIYSGNVVTIANNTIVSPSDGTSSSAGINQVSIYAGGVIRVINNAIFGFASNAALSGSGTVTASNTATDLASVAFGGSGNQTSKTYTSQFVGTTAAAQDFRAKAAADILDNGATDTTDIPGATDIVGTARPQGSAWDIGAWELVAAAVGMDPMPQIWM